MTKQLTLICAAVLCGCMKHTPIPTPTPVGSGRNVTITWTASTTPNVSYNVYRATGPCPGTTPVKLNTSPVTALTYTDADIAVGKWCYWATSFLTASAQQESVPSNKADVEVIQQPNPPTNLQVTPPAATVLTGTQQQFTANIPGATWSISPADMGTIDATGLYTAPSSIKGNNVAVTVTATSGLQTATAAVTLRKN